jgi:hypothetical protein
MTLIEKLKVRVPELTADVVALTFLQAHARQEELLQPQMRTDKDKEDFIS